MTNSDPCVSVIVPTYNHAHLIAGCLASLQNQSVGNWEAIVVNNHSTDDTEAVVAGLKDPRIRLVNFANQGVIAAARNLGVRLARAPVIAFLDSDDLWFPGKLKACLDRINNRHDLVWHAVEMFSEDGFSRVLRVNHKTPIHYRTLLEGGNCIWTSAVVMRKSVFSELGGFSENRDMIMAEDYDLWLRVARSGAALGFVDEVLGQYRLHGSSQSRAAHHQFQAVLAVINQHLLAPRPASEPSSSVPTPASAPHPPSETLRYRKRVSLAQYFTARTLQYHGQFEAATPWLLSSLAGWPFRVRAWAALVLNTLHFRV